MVKNLVFAACALATFVMVAFDETPEAKKELVIEKPPIVMLMGPPGSGQGVLAVKLAKAYALPHISPATLLVEQVHQPTEMGMKARDFLNSRHRVPDSFILTLLAQRLKSEDVKKGCLLDGIPDSKEQIAELQKMVGDKFRLLPISITIADNTLVMQEEGRLVCRSCCRVYHSTFSPPEEPMTCDNCMCLLTQLEEDTRESVMKRLTEWHEENDALINSFRRERLLVEVNGNHSFNTTLNEIKQSYLDALHPEI